VKDSAEVPPDLPKQQLLAVLRREHNMVHALPCRVVQMISRFPRGDRSDSATQLPKL
jgi:hypothetical protein